MMLAFGTWVAMITWTLAARPSEIRRRTARYASPPPFLYTAAHSSMMMYRSPRSYFLRPSCSMREYLLSIICTALCRESSQAEGLKPEALLTVCGRSLYAASSTRFGSISTN